MIDQLGDNIVIGNSASYDKLSLGSGISLADFSTSEVELNGITVVTLADDKGGRIVLQGGALDEIDFADGTIVSVAQMESQTIVVGNVMYASTSAVAAENVTNLVMTGSADVIATGNELDDLIRANAGHNTLIAGSGNDTLVGGGLSDTYTVGASFSTEIDQSSAADTLVFSQSINLAQMTASSAILANGMTEITIDEGNGNTITVEQSKYGILDNLAFADGSTASLAATVAKNPNSGVNMTSSVSIGHL